MARTAVEEIRDAAASRGLELAPGLNAEEIAALQDDVGAPLPRELTDVLAETAGSGDVDFTGRSMNWEAPELFPSGLPVATDGAGNFWVLDLTPTTTESAPVFFVAHDPPVVIYQTPSLGQFLHELFTGGPDVDTWTTPATRSDATVDVFARELGEGWEIVDLRTAEPGAGFEWGRFGPLTELRRCGYERLFALKAPERKPGLLRRLFG